MRKEFQSRSDLEQYLRTEFPDVDGDLSPIRGGRESAHSALAEFDATTYGRTRNYVDGAVSRLSPYIRHGVLTLSEVLRYISDRFGGRRSNYKFLQELAWRDYWQRIYCLLKDDVWRDREEYKTGFSAGDYREEIPRDVLDGHTGLVCIDAFTTQLQTTGYVHNHARMWLAAYIVHWRKVRWQAGARWFLSHLLDGDPASNNLSWQWVASTFSEKPYFFNRENLEKYTHGSYCRRCPKFGSCDFEGSYEELEAKLFR